MTEMVYATYALLVDWNNDGDYGDAGETVSSDLISSYVRRGFANPLARVARVGEATLALDNTDQSYSPESVANVLPRRPVRLRMTYDGTTETIYQGYLDSIDPSHAVARPIKTVTFGCVDDMDSLDRYEGEIAIQTNTRADDIITSVVAAVYTPSGTDYDTGINAFPVASDRWTGRLSGQGAVGGVSSGVVQEFRASDKILDACTSDWGHFYIAKGGTPTFRNRHAMPFDSSTVLTLNETMSSIRYVKSAQPILNYVAVTCYPRKIGESNEILGELDQTTPPSIEDGEAATFDIRFRDPSNNAITLGGKDVINPPVATTDFTCTDDEPGEGTDETANVTPTATIYGDHAEVTLTNTAGHIVYVQSLQVRGIAVRSWQPVTVVAEDSTSQTAYGRRVLRLDAPLMSSPVDAQALANWLLDYYKDPVPEVSVTFSANANATLMAAARDLELLDRVVLTDSQTGLSSDAFYVYGITHDIPAKHRHMVTLDLMQAYSYGADPWTWDTSTWDGGDVWVY